MTLQYLYWLSIILLAIAMGAAFVLAFRKRACQPLTTVELATVSLLICLLHVAVVPWQAGFAKVPGLDALIFSIPYTVVFLLGLSLAPKPGFATLLIFGQGVLGQLLGRGVNPAWWPYYLWCALGVELLVVASRGRVKSLSFMLGAGLLRGLIADTYLYLILAPFLWRQFYAPWYVATKIAVELVGCAIGALIAWQLAPTIEKASRHSSL